MPRKIFLLLALLCLQALIAQQYFFKNYSVESGLPFVQVSCMHQDSNGYLWSGGYGGLSRFDGKVFQNYNKRNGLVDHNVNAIQSDTGGAVYIGTSKGLSVLYRKRFTNYTLFGKINKPNVTSLCKGYHHAIYLGTGNGLFMFRGGQVLPVKRFENDRINYLFNPDTSVIFAATDRGLVIFGHNEWRRIDMSSGLPSDRVTCIDKFRNFIVIGTTAGLALLETSTGKLTTFRAAHGLIDEHINAIRNQRGEFLWIATPSGLLRFDGQSFSPYEIAADNNSNHIRCLLNDREDNLWIGTHSGIYRYRDNSFSTFTSEGLGTAFSFQIFRDRSKALWVTTQNSGVYRLRESQIERFTEKNGLPGNTSRSAIEDDEGRLLFGTEKGLYQFENGRFVRKPTGEELAGPIEVLYQGRDRRLWLGGSNGFAGVHWENDQPRSVFYPIEWKSDRQVYGFCEDDDGALYIGTFHAGIFRLKNDSLVNLTERYQLQEENFFTLRYAAGKVFAASLNGVLVFDVKTNTLARVTYGDGLNSDLVYSLEFSRDMRYLWIGTNQGINRLDLPEYLKTGKKKIMAFGRQEGFTGVECNNGIWEDDDGTLWFGTVSGIVRHQPNAFKRNLIENKTLVQRIALMNEDTLLTHGAELPSGYNTISFYFRGICLTNPDNVLYQRKLEGLREDREWSEPSSDNFIKYTNLPPGAYTFKVRSCNNEGIWNTKETVFSFNIRLPFYQSWWFVVVSVGLIASGVYGFFMYRVYTIKRKQRLEFERRVEMSKIELKALRAQMNPHFVFNSLNAIQHYIFNTKSDEAIKYLNKFARLMRVILNNSDKQSVTVSDDLEALRLYLELEQMRFEGKFEYQIIVDKTVDTDYDIMPPLLMQPYVENSILHGLNPKPGKGLLTISLHSENNFLICTITDNGIGRAKAAEIRRTMPVKKHQSLGMKITEDRLRILNEINNSQLSVTVTDLMDENGNSTGTRVELFVPLMG